MKQNIAEGVNKLICKRVVRKQGYYCVIKVVVEYKGGEHDSGGIRDEEQCW